MMTIFFAKGMDWERKSYTGILVPSILCDSMNQAAMVVSIATIVDVVKVSITTALTNSFRFSLYYIDYLLSK